MPSSVDGVMMVVTTLMSLVLVLALAYFLLKWLSRRVNVQSGTSQKIRIIDRVPLAPDKCLLVVRVAEKTVLVGMSSHCVAKICDIEDPDGILTQTGPSQESFASLLRRSVGKKRQSPSGQEDMD